MLELVNVVMLELVNVVMLELVNVVMLECDKMGVAVCDNVGGQKNNLILTFHKNRCFLTFNLSFIYRCFYSVNLSVGEIKYHDFLPNFCRQALRQ